MKEASHISGGIMGHQLLCLTLLCWLAGSYAQKPCILITPSVFHMDFEETIVIDGLNTAFDADVIVEDFPVGQYVRVVDRVSVNASNQFLGIMKIKIPSFAHYTRILQKKHFVTVTVTSTWCSLRKTVLVSPEAGYIFIQTDKTVYTKGSTVLARFYTMNYNLKSQHKEVIFYYQGPDNVIVKRSVLLSSRIGSHSFTLDELASSGVWTISASYGGSLQQYTAHFEVKDYVQPDVDISIEPHEPFFYIQDQDYTIKIQATYTHGIQVNGDAFVLFGVKRGNERKHLPDSLRRTKIYHGEGKAILERKDLQKVFSNEQEMMEWTLYVTVTVITDSGSGIIKEELENIPIVNKLYKIIFTKTPAYFKPGLPHDFMVLVTNPDGSPARGVPVVVQPGLLRGITQDKGIVKLTLNTEANINSLQIMVKTDVPSFKNEHQATASMTATAYKPVSGNYLHLSVAGTELLRVGKNVFINFIIRNSNPTILSQINHFTYLVLSRGQIIKVGRQEKKESQTLVTLVLPITWELLPSFRFVAYYVVKTGLSHEIVSDSIWIDVEDSCKLEITEDNTRRGKELNPGAFSRVKMTADYKALVNLLIVEKSVHKQNAKFWMSQKKVWDIVGQSDSGCTAGAGADGLQVFYDAGLALQSNFGKETTQRSEYLCKGTERRVRRAIVDGLDKTDVRIRNEFPETMWWKTETIHERPDRNGVSTKLLSVFLKDTIATWEVVAVSLVEGKGICVAPPLEIKVVKSFFIDLKLPFSVELNEQVEIYAIIFNNKEHHIKVHVKWVHSPELCSAFNMQLPYSQEVTIQSFSSVRLPFVFVPTSLGSHNVEMRATAGPSVSDGIQKKIKVVPKGHLVHTTQSIVLEPAVKGKDGVQVEKMTALDSVDHIDHKANIYTTFTMQAHPLIEMVKRGIDGAHLDHLIKEVKGNGESNMVALTAPVMASFYLDTIHQWGQLQLNRRDEAIQHIQSGIINQLTFRKPDYSYGQTITSPASTWLTAYIVKIFSLADNLFRDDNLVICNSVKWLLLLRQKPDGLFEESTPVSNQEMMGGNKRTSNELKTTLTAFVLVAILESRKICNNFVSFSSIENSVAFLRIAYPSLKNPYSVAITSYALALAGGLQDTNTLMAASTGNYWNDPNSRFVSIEATSYALLALIKMEQWNSIDRIVQWLIEQNFYGGTTGDTTQATVMMFQALARYYTVAYQLDMEVLLRFPTRAFERFILKTDSILTHSRVISFQMSVKEDCTITAKGKGLVNLTITRSYYSNYKKDCDNYDLSVTAREEYLVENPKDVKSTVAITICVRSLKASYASLAVVEVVMLSGFIPDTSTLDKLKERKDMSIDFNLSKGPLIFYLSKVSQTKKQCLQFNVHQYFWFEHLQPASVTIYDYYIPDNRCTKFYHMKEENKDLNKVCKEDICRCTEGNCYFEHQIDDNNPDFLYNKICEESVAYAYKATLSDIEDSDSYTTYVMTIQRVFKEGADEVSQGWKRNFLNHKACQHFLKLEKGRDYFLWGKSEDLWSLPSVYSYIIGKDTWFEWFPNPNDCQNPKYSYLCEKAQQLEEDLDFKGCML
ncbi:A.superbus venom factor 1-like isoform X2 [Aquarana catesbeiana]|uniref:A.superbus venom factor 1-like isoform X2 n=1 Tax=Aquarana catesbeiana TaxID=8400 RepID=UPI003CCA0484